MARASLCIFTLHVAVFGVFAQTFLSVSPDRFQFFNYESVRLSCSLPKVTAGSAKWKIKRNSAKGEQESCPSSWGTLNGSSCNIMDTYSGDTGVYWCESDSGERSSAVNITVTDGSLIRNESTGEMTIPAVSKSDEGRYKCNHSALGESPESWLAVRIPKPPPSVSLRLILVTGISVALFIIITGMLFCCWTKQRDKRSVQGPEPVYSAVMTYSHLGVLDSNNDRTGDDVTYSDINHKVKRKPQKKKRGDRPSDPVYSAVRTGGPVTVPKNVTYGQIKIRSNIKPQAEKAQSESDMIYSTVKPGHSAGP